MPRRRIRPSKSQDLMVLIESDHLLVDKMDVRRGFSLQERLGLVVVAADPVQRDVERGQVLLGHFGPSPNLVDHPVGEQRLDLVRIRSEAGVLVLRHPDRIRAGVRDRFLNGRQLGLGEVVASPAREARLVAAVSLLHDGRDRFGGQIPTDEEGVGIVERRGAQKLPKGDL